MLNAILLVVVTASADAGTDIPFADPDAGIYQISSAELPDGGTLPSGWWISSARLTKLGNTLVTLQNDKVDLQNALNSAEPPFMQTTRSFLVGLGVGTVVGVAISLLIAYTLK